MSESVFRSAARAADRVEPGVSPTVVKGVLGVTSLTSLLFGLRSAWKHSRQPEAADLVRAQVLGGLGFATRALALATCITVSGFALTVVGVSWALDVNTPKQFGSAMKSVFGEKFRLESSKTVTTSADFEKLLESVSSLNKEQESVKVIDSVHSTIQSISIPQFSINNLSSIHYADVGDYVPHLPSSQTTVLLILVFLLFIVLIALLCIGGRRGLPLRPRSRILLVIAHPDDETMFFAPTLTQITRQEHRVFVLCVSTGDFYGQGQRRVVELRQAVAQLGVQTSDLTVLDYDHFKDGHSWDKELLSRVLLRFVESLGVDVVLSFDGGGVSSHPNHVACFEALQYLYSRGEMPAELQVFCLDSVSLLRKYVSLLDSPLSIMRSPFRYFASPRQVLCAWKAMWQHRSQLMWFRVLFMIFSRYIVVNTFRRIPPQVRHPRKKKDS